MLPITTILIWCLGLLLLTIGWARLLGFHKYRKMFIGYTILQSLFTLGLIIIEIDARSTPGNGGWMMIFASIIQFHIGTILGAIALIKTMINKTRNKSE